MAFREGSFPVQLFASKLIEMFGAFGWNLTAKAPIKYTGAGIPSRIDAYLFTSRGSDSKDRNFGMVHAYGGGTVTTPGNEEVITHNSVLGVMDRVGSTQQYLFRVFPIETSVLKVFINGVEKTLTTDYTVDSGDCGITFTGAVTIVGTEEVTATFAVSDDAPQKPDKLWFFTYEDYILLTGKTVNPTSKIMTETTATGAFDVDDGKDVMEEVYAAFRFIKPSPPTSFTIINEYSNGWSRDSELFYWGNITRDRIAMFFRIDPSPNPPLAYTIPLYIGKITTLGADPKLNNVIVSGAKTGGDIIPWGATAVTIGGDQLDYGNTPSTNPTSTTASNGNDGVQLQKTIGGSYYQKHYLSFITHDDQADPSPESQYNPSVYTGKYHISPMYIVHPNDGFVGMLDEVYAVHPKHISQLDELEVKETATNEFIGTGDGVRTVFYTRHTPKHDLVFAAGASADFAIKVDCSVVHGEKTATGAPATEAYAIMEEPTAAVPDKDDDNQTKAITFATAPTLGQEIYATYTYEQTYCFTLPDTLRTPFRDELVCPYVPIGLAVLKKNEPFPVGT